MLSVVSLNCWNGRVFDPLMAFFTKMSPDVDVFCLQEVYSTDICIGENFEAWSEDKKNRLDLLQEIEAVLPDHESYFMPTQYGLEQEAEKFDSRVRRGTAVFVRRGLEILEVSATWIVNSAPEFGNKRRYLQTVHLKKDGVEYVVANYHGVWRGASKDDSPERTTQSTNIVRVLERFWCHKILVGDFNLLPNTRSIGIIEDNGLIEGQTGQLINLIKTHEVKTTRSSLLEKKRDVGDLVGGHALFADYAFVSPSLEVAEFRVLSDEVSDHLPLFLRCEGK